MGQYIKVCSVKANEKAKGNSFGLTDLHMKENFNQTIFRALGYIHGINGESMKGNGKMEK